MIKDEKPIKGSFLSTKINLGEGIGKFYTANYNNGKGKTITGLLIITLLLTGTFTSYQSSYGAIFTKGFIPPTQAFKTINGTGGNVTAGNYKDFITFAEGTGIALSWDYTLHKITFSSNGAGNPIEKYCTGTDKIYAYNSTTHLFICSTVTSNASGQNNTASSSGLGQSLILPKVLSDLPFKGLAVSGDLSISSNSTDITIGHTNTSYTIPKIFNQTSQKDYQVTGINNVTGVITTNQFSVNTISVNGGDTFVNSINNATGQVTTKIFSVNLTTCSGTDKVSAIDNSTGNVICSTDSTGSGATNIPGNVTGTLPGTDYLLATITLTANSGNTVSGVLSVDSTVSGTAVRSMANVTNLGTGGWCHWITPLTTTTDSIDNIVMNTILTGRATNTADITGLAGANVEYPISFECSVRTGATPGSMKIFMTPEVTGATISLKNGYYIKTP